MVTREIRIGLFTSQTRPWQVMLERWRLFDALGYDSAWLGDHFFLPSNPEGSYLESWTLLAALAARTERIRIGVLVSSNTFRHPALLAKQAITVDQVSGGRLTVGLGAGWNPKEHAMYGVPWHEVREQIDRFEDAVQVIDLLLGNGLSSFDSRWYPLHDAISQPRPLQTPRPPIMVGALGPRMIGIAARRADIWNTIGDPASIAERNRLADWRCHQAGRDPESLERSAQVLGPTSGVFPWRSVETFEGLVAPLIEAGVNEVIVTGPEDGDLDVVERVAVELLPRLRAAGAPPRPELEGEPPHHVRWPGAASFTKR